MASSHTNQCQHYYTLEIHYLRLLGIECFHPSWNIQVNYLFAIPTLVSPSSVQISCRTCHRSIQTTYCSDNLLDGGFQAPHSSQNAHRHSSLLFYYKRSCCGCSSRLDSQGSAITAFNPLAAQRCLLCSWVLFFNPPGSGGDDSSIYEKLPAMLKGMGRLVCSRGYSKQCIFCP